MCDKCEKEEDLGFDYVCSRIVNNVIELEYDAYSVDSSFNVSLEIEYCPFCGKKLDT
jgi:hypothetical protein